jgi:integrase
MGRHKLPYKMKKPNAHHKYWRYVLSMDPHRSEISTRTKVKYEAERIAKQAYWDALEKMNNCPTFGDYAKDFFTDKCRLTARRKSSNKAFTDDMIKLKRSNLTKYLLKEYENTYLTDIKMLQYEDFRSRLNLANSTKNGITVTMKQIMNEAVRDEVIESHQLDKIESLSEVTEKPRDSLSIEEIKKLFPINYDEAIAIWKEPKYYTLMFILVSSGMRSGEVRALKWSDVMWEDSGIIISKAVKHSGEIGTVKEKKEKIVRLPQRAMDILQLWKDISLAPGDEDFIFYGKNTDKPVDKNTIIDNFKKGLANAKVGDGKHLVPHSLRHTFNSYMLTVLPSDVVRKFTGHSSEEMTKHYYHPFLKEELKATERYQDKIDSIWGE